MNQTALMYHLDARGKSARYINPVIVAKAEYDYSVWLHDITWAKTVLACGLRRNSWCQVITPVNKS